MKTPDDIKKGLKVCGNSGYCQRGCPYFKTKFNITQCTAKLTRDALAYIRKLEARNAWHECNGKYLASSMQSLSKQVNQLESQVSKWISVEERLPKHGEIVFCNTTYFYEVLQWDDDAEQWVGQYSVNAKHYVTHWMPLPEPPKEDDYAQTD